MKAGIYCQDIAMELKMQSVDINENSSVHIGECGEQSPDHSHPVTVLTTQTHNQHPTLLLPQPIKTMHSTSPVATDDPSPPPDPFPAQPLGGVLTEQAAVVMAGFQDCSEEAIRYLVDVEGIPEEDALICGLRQHLWERQQMLNYERIISQLLAVQNAQIIASQSTETAAAHPADDSGIGSPLREAEEEDDNCVTSSNDAAVVTKHWTTECDSVNDHESTVDETEMDDSHVDDSLSPDNSHLSVSMEEEEGEDTDVEEDNDGLNPMYTLAMLAQNNPQIASLTDELFSLLGAGPLDDTLDTSLDESQ